MGEGPVGRGLGPAGRGLGPEREADGAQWARGGRGPTILCPLNWLRTQGAKGTPTCMVSRWRPRLLT